MNLKQFMLNQVYQIIKNRIKLGKLRYYFKKIIVKVNYNIFYNII